MKNDIERLYKSFSDDLSKVSINNLHPDIFNSIKINGSSIKKYCSLNNDDLKTVVIEVWDKRYVSEIQKEIQKQFLNFNYRTDGNKIYISSPNMSEQYRNELARDVKNMGEQVKIKFRTLKQKYDKKIAGFNNPQSVKNKNQKMVNDYCSKVDVLVKDKISVIKTA